MSDSITSDTGIPPFDPNSNAMATVERPPLRISKNRVCAGVGEHWGQGHQRMHSGGWVLRAGGAGKGVGEDPARSSETPEEERGPPQTVPGAGFCKWFNVRMGFGFISMTSSEGALVDPPLDVFVHQSKLVMEGFRSLKEGEQVEFTYKKSSKGLESLRVTGPGGGPCAGSERRPKGKVLLQKRKPKGDRCYNCGGLDHHAKECGLPPQPKKCHYCQSIAHMYGGGEEEEEARGEEEHRPGSSLQGGVSSGTSSSSSHSRSPEESRGVRHRPAITRRRKKS
ncbi:Protein lin-28 B [Merluccius polli]|uniref:Protein lin-28 B n=1 Tax=Merluccius polli TaxID=89951 RepID=A0AA47NZ47_MERPO|nr:Protein lin-28 B [Merluccius polli]